MRLYTPLAVAKILTYQSDNEIEKKQILELFAKKFKYCTEKYSVSNKADSSVKSEVPIWYEQRKNEWGVYLALYTVDTAALDKEESDLYNTIVSLWNDSVNKNIPTTKV